MDCSGPQPLDWLNPTLAVCRGIVEYGVHRADRKPVDSGRELVTDVDLQIERALTSAIRSRLPDAAIVSEESPFSPSVLDDADTCFIIDPIDGTDELAAGRPGFSISVAEYRHGSPVAAVVDFPRMAIRFAGAVGSGTCLGDRPVRLETPTGINGARVAVSATQRRDSRLQPVWSGIDTTETVPISAFTPKFAAVLRGDCVAALHLPVDDRQTHIWDYAGVATLLAAAGGIFTNWNGQDLLRARPLVHVGGWIAAATPQLADEIRAAVRPAIHRLQAGR
jgi:myo-inositol-1(or 4)-monophosphatase